MGWEGGGGGRCGEGRGREGGEEGREIALFVIARCSAGVCRIGTIVAKGEKDEGGGLVWVFCCFLPALCSCFVFQGRGLNSLLFFFLEIH